MYLQKTALIHVKRNLCINYLHLCLCLYLFCRVVSNNFVDRPHNRRKLHHQSGDVPQLTCVDLAFRTWKILSISHPRHCAMSATVVHHQLLMSRSPTQWSKVCVPITQLNICMYKYVCVCVLQSFLMIWFVLLLFCICVCI